MQRNQYGNLSYTSLTKWFMCCLGALKLEVFLLLGAFAQQLRKATASFIMYARMVQAYFHEIFSSKFVLKLSRPTDTLYLKAANVYDLIDVHNLEKLRCL